MARPGVTYTEVENAAKRLQAEGRHPTIDAIRQLIGSGSDSTIMRHLKAWKERHTLELQSGNLPLPLIETIQGLWNRIKHEASAEIAKHEAETAEEIEAMEAVVKRAQEQEHTLRREAVIFQSALTNAEIKIEELSALLQAERTENIRLKEQKEGLERQCAQQSEEIDRQHQIVQQTQANLEHYQAANLKLKETHSLERENERNQYLQSVRGLEAQVNVLFQEKALLDHTLKHADKTLSEAGETIGHLQTVCQTLTNEASESKTKIALLDHQNQTLIQQASKQEQQLKESSEQLCNALNQISSLTNKQDLLESALKKAEDKGQTLMDEKLFWLHEKAELAGRIKLNQGSK